MKTIYLSGSISQDPLTQDWREVARQALEARGWTVLDPMRGKSRSRLSPDGLRANDAPVPQLVTRDYADIRRSSIQLVVYWRDPTDQSGKRRQSIGTWWECGFAECLGIPLVVVTDAPEVTSHPFIQRKAAAIVDSIEEGIRVIEWIGGAWT